MTEVQFKHKKSTIISEGADIKRADPSSYYVDNAQFYEALVKRREQVETAKAAGTPVPKPSDYIGLCFMKIATGMSLKWNFRNYPFREELVGTAIEDMVKAVDSFDVTKGKNPFSYFSQTTFFAFIGSIRVEKRKLATKFKATLDALAFQEIWCSDDPDYTQMIAEENLPDTAYMAEFVKEFEESEKKKRRVKGEVEPSPFNLEELDAAQTEPSLDGTTPPDSSDM